MYKISQFSKLSGMSIKTLRYYDQESILTPSYRDENNQYRYYNDEDLKKALLIKHLRALEFSIMEIKEIFAMASSQMDINYILQEKIQIIEKNISKEKELIQQIHAQLSADPTCAIQHTYTMDIVEVEELFVASIRFVGKYSDLNAYVPILYKAVKGGQVGKHLNCYYDEGYCEQADIELCLPIKKEIQVSTITCKNLPSIKALHTTHIGSYETLHFAYKALFEYANHHNITILTPSREVYRKGPGMIFKGNPNAYCTEIFLPFEINGKDQ